MRFQTKQERVLFVKIRLSSNLLQKSSFQETFLLDSVVY